MIAASFRRLAAGVAVLLLAAAGLTACDNTIRGVGQDVKDTGRAVEDTFE